jgi:DNA-binding MarR family transcriptional regulator
MHQNGDAMSRAEELASSITNRYLALNRRRRHVGGLIHKKFGIHGRQLAVLRYLVSEGARSVRQISEYLYVSDATTSPLLERMERDGYVTRRRCKEDNRKLLVEATDLGRDIAARAPKGVTGLLRDNLPELSIEELETIDWALAKLSEVSEIDESLST